MAIGQFQKGLLGYDPMEVRALEQKQWQSLYANAQSPYEKMGIALGQLGGALLGGFDSSSNVKAKTINEAIAAAGQQYTQGTAEYYKAISDALPADAMFTDSKEFATQKYAEVKKAEDAAFNESSKSISDRPDTYNVLAAPLAQALVVKAKANGYDESTPLPTTSKEISQFAKDYGLVRDPVYGKLISLTKTYEAATSEKTTKAEKDVLSIEQIKTNIKLDNARLGQIGKEDFDKGARWNAENAAAREFLSANKIDLNKPLTGSARANPAFVEAYQKALRNDWSGSKGITSPASGGKPAQPTTTPIALPPSPKDAVIGQVYSTSQGPAQWDGKKFNAVAK
jgi:hypothetical protein